MTHQQLCGLVLGKHTFCSGFLCALVKKDLRLNVLEAMQSVAYVRVSSKLRSLLRNFQKDKPKTKLTHFWILYWYIFYSGSSLATKGQLQGGCLFGGRKRTCQMGALCFVSGTSIWEESLLWKRSFPLHSLRPMSDKTPFNWDLNSFTTPSLEYKGGGGIRMCCVASNPTQVKRENIFEHHKTLLFCCGQNLFRRKQRHGW